MINLFKLADLNIQEDKNIIFFLKRMLTLNNDPKGIFGPTPNQRSRIVSIIGKTMRNMTLEDFKWLQSSLSDDIKNKTANFQKLIDEGINFISKGSQSVLEKGTDAIGVKEKMTIDVPAPEKTPTSQPVTEESKPTIVDTKPSTSVSTPVSTADKKFLMFKVEKGELTIQPSLSKNVSDKVKEIIKKHSKNITFAIGNIFTVSKLNQDSYNALIEDLKSAGWDTEGLKELGDQLPSKESLSNKKNYAETRLEFKIALDETNNSFDFLIKAPDIDTLDIDKMKHVNEIVSVCFVGETTNKNLGRGEHVNPENNELTRGYQYRRCPVAVVADAVVLKSGIYVRGTPSDFARFINLSKTRKAFEPKSLEKFNRAIHEYGLAGKFFDGRKNSYISPDELRFEGDLDGYNNEDDFIDAAQKIAKVQLQGALRRKGKTAESHPDEFSKLGLYDAQIDGIKFLYSKTNAILGDETGYGKTVQLLTAAQLRILREQAKDKTGVGKGGLILTKNAVVQEMINGLADIGSVVGFNANQVWDGDMLFDYIKRNRLDEKERAASAPVPPPWRWCVINYEKFSIPPADPERKKANLEAKRNAFKSNHLNARNLLSDFMQKIYGSGEDKPASLLIEGIKNTPGIHPDIKSVALSLVDVFFKVNFEDIKSRIMYDLMFDKSRTSVQKMPRSQAESIAAEKMKSIKEKDGDYIKVNASKFLRILKELEVYQNTLFANEDKKTNNAIARIVSRQEVPVKQAEKMQIINNPNSSTEEIEAAREEWDVLEEMRYRYLDGGKRAILTKYLEHMAKSGYLTLTALDEIHTVKNGDPDKQDISGDLEHEENYTTFNIQEVTNNVSNVWGASATVVANKPIDLFNQLQAVNNPLGDLGYDSFIGSVSSGIPGMSGAAGTGRAIRDALVQQGVYLQRTKNQIWDKKKSDEIKLIVKNTSGVSIKDSQAKSILDLLRQMKSTNKLDASLLKENIKSLLGKNINDSVIKSLISLNPDNVEQKVSVVDAKDEVAIESSVKEDFDKRFRERMEITMSKGVIGPNLRLAAFTHYRFAAAEVKVPNTLALIKPYIDRGERVGVFTASSEAVEMLVKGIQEMLDSSPLSGKSVLKIVGGQNLEDRFADVNEFKKSIKDSSFGAAVINIKAGGTGISLENTANFSVFNDLPISVSEDDQALGRFFRINTESDVQAVYVVAPQISSDEKFYDNLQAKKQIAREIANLEEQDREYIAMGLYANSDERRKLLQKIAEEHKKMKEKEAEFERIKMEVVNNAVPENTPSGKKPSKSRRKKANSDIGWYKLAQSLFLYNLGRSS